MVQRSRNWLWSIVLTNSTKLPMDKTLQLGHLVSIRGKISCLHQNNIHKCQSTLKFAGKHLQFKQKLWKFWPSNVLYYTVGYIMILLYCFPPIWFASISELPPGNTYVVLPDINNLSYFMYIHTSQLTSGEDFGK